MTPSVGGQVALPVLPREVPLRHTVCSRYGGDIICGAVARVERRNRCGKRAPYSGHYGEVPFGDFTHSNSEMAFILFMFYEGGRAMVELANTLRNQHGGEIAIADFLNRGIEERMLGSQGSAS